MVDVNGNVSSSIPEKNSVRKTTDNPRIIVLLQSSSFKLSSNWSFVAQSKLITTGT